VAKNYGKLVVMLEHKTSKIRVPVEHPDLGGNTQDAVRWARDQPEIQGFAYVVTRDMARVTVTSAMTNTATVESIGGDGNGEDDPEPEPEPETAKAPEPKPAAKVAPKPKPKPAPASKDLLSGNAATGHAAKKDDDDSANNGGDNPF